MKLVRKTIKKIYVLQDNVEYLYVFNCDSMGSNFLHVLMTCDKRSTGSLRHLSSSLHINICEIIDISTIRNLVNPLKSDHLILKLYPLVVSLINF